MSKLLTEIRDGSGNIHYPHSSTDVIFYPDQSITELATRDTYAEWVLVMEDYREVEYPIGGYLKNGEFWFTGDYFTRDHYMGTKIPVTPGTTLSFKVSAVRNLREDTRLVAVVLDGAGDSLWVSELDPGSTNTVLGEVEIPPTGATLLIGVNYETEDPTPRRVGYGLSVIDTAQKSYNVTDFTNDIQSGAKVAGKSKMLDTGVTVVVSPTRPAPVDGVKIVWVKSSI